MNLRATSGTKQTMTSNHRVKAMRFGLDLCMCLVSDEDFMVVLQRIEIVSP